MYAAQNGAQRPGLGGQDEIPENRPSAHRLGFQTFKAKTILQRLKHGEKLSPEDFFTLRKSLKKILRIIQGNFYHFRAKKIRKFLFFLEIDVNEELPENADSMELRLVFINAAL